MWRFTLQLILVAASAVVMVAQEPLESSVPLEVLAEIDTFFGNSESGMLVPLAHISFFRMSADQLCVVVAAKRGPKGLRKNYLSFRRILTTDQGNRQSKYKFKFANATDSASGHYSRWEQCLAGETRGMDGEQDELEVTIRRPDQGPTSFSIINPRAGYVRGAAVREDPRRQVMLSRNFVEKLVVD
jgi:hypothetical protein